MAKGPITEEEKEFILNSLEELSVEAIAEELDRKPETINRFLGRERSKVVENALPENGGAIMTESLSEKGDDLYKRRISSKQKVKSTRKNGLFIMDKNRPTG